MNEVYEKVPTIHDLSSRELLYFATISPSSISQKLFEMELAVRNPFMFEKPTFEAEDFNILFDFAREAVLPIHPNKKDLSSQ